MLIAIILMQREKCTTDLRIRWKKIIEKEIIVIF